VRIATFNINNVNARLANLTHWLTVAQPDVYRRLLDQGWTDALRTLQPEGPLWTFWGYLRHRWQNDKGMRLDHLLLSPDLAGRLIAAGVSRSTRGEAGASDHAPTWIELARAPATRAAPSRRSEVARRGNLRRSQPTVPARGP
jgi:exonuclease III